MPPDLALLSTLTGSNYLCLELIFMVPKVFEPLKLTVFLLHIITYNLVTSSASERIVRGHLFMTAPPCNALNFIYFLSV